MLAPRLTIVFLKPPRFTRDFLSEVKIPSESNDLMLTKIQLPSGPYISSLEPILRVLASRRVTTRCI